MHYETDSLYHVYNRGNNGQQLFSGLSITIISCGWYANTLPREQTCWHIA